MTGTLSPDWFELESFSLGLVILNLSSCNLTGSLPAAWANSSAYVFLNLDLSSNQISGGFAWITRQHLASVSA